MRSTACRPAAVSIRASTPIGVARDSPDPPASESGRPRRGHRGARPSARRGSRAPAPAATIASRVGRHQRGRDRVDPHRDAARGPAARRRAPPSRPRARRPLPRREPNPRGRGSPHRPRSRAPCSSIFAGEAGTDRHARRALTAPSSIGRRGLTNHLGSAGYGATCNPRDDGGAVDVGGPWFEDFELGQVFDDAPALTLTAGTPPSIRRSSGDRLRLPLDARAVPRGDRARRARWPIRTSSATSPSGSRPGRRSGCVGNLFYRGLVLLRPVFIGDTLRTRTEVVAPEAEPAAPRRHARPGSSRCGSRPRTSAASRCSTSGAAR